MHLKPLGMITPVGLSLEASVAAMRAGIDGFADLSYRDDQGEPIVGAPVPVLDPDLRLRERLAELLALLLADLAEQCPECTALPVLACLPSPSSPGIDGKLRSLVEDAEERAGLRLRRNGARAFAAGRTAAFEALAHARLSLSRDLPQILLIAVDSLIGARRLLALDQAFRLKKAANSDGVIPGEAACAALVSAEPGETAMPLHGVGFGSEPATILNEEPCLAVGLTAAVRDALEGAAAAMHDVGWTLSDTTGEAYFFEEIAIAHARNSTEPRGERPLWHAAEAIGDSGAAAGLVHLGMAAIAFARGYAPARLAIVQGSDDGTARAAAIVGEAREARSR